jgi:hypothetical protein
VRVLKKEEKNGRETERIDKGKGEARVVGRNAVSPWEGAFFPTTLKW